MSPSLSHSSLPLAPAALPAPGAPTCMPGQVAPFKFGQTAPASSPTSSSASPAAGFPFAASTPAPAPPQASGTTTKDHYTPSAQPPETEPRTTAPLEPAKVKIIAAPSASEIKPFTQQWLAAQNPKPGFFLKQLQGQLQHYLLGNKNGSNLLKATQNGQTLGQAILIEPNAFFLLRLLNRVLSIYPAGKTHQRFAVLAQPVLHPNLKPSTSNAGSASSPYLNVSQAGTALRLLVEGARSEIERTHIQVLYAVVPSHQAQQLTSLGFKPLLEAAPQQYPAQAFLLNHLNDDGHQVMVWKKPEATAANPTE